MSVKRSRSAQNLSVKAERNLLRCCVRLSSSISSSPSAQEMPEWRRIENCSQKWKSSSLVSLFFWRINCLLKVWVRSGPDIQLLIWYPWVAMVNVWTVRCNCHRPLCIAECFLYPCCWNQKWDPYVTRICHWILQLCQPSLLTDINADPACFTVPAYPICSLQGISLARSMAVVRAA